MHDEHHEQKTSLYLVRRAEALLGALRHFEAAGSDAVRKRLRFLTQSDFWEWEVENLIYSFTNLTERSRVWEADAFAIRKLGQLGIKLDAKLTKRVQWRRGWRLDASVQRVAPIELLEQVIAVWNGLIDQCEAHFVRPMQEKARKYGIETRSDLAHLRKPMPDLVQNTGNV